MKKMAKRRKKIPAFTAPRGRTLFLFEKGDIRIFGTSETTIPVTDLAAFLEHCDEEVSSSNPTKTPEPLDE